MPEVFVSVGSNIDRDTNVSEALRLMQEPFGELVVSTVYETESVGFSGPNFYNLVAGFETRRPLEEVERILVGIEDARGRRRGGGADSSDRTLDLDVLLYGDTVDHDGRDLPRGDILSYAFVLCPLAEIAPRHVHPECGRCYADLWSSFADRSQRLWPVGKGFPEPGRVAASTS